MRERKPFLLIGSPKCTAFSQLQKWSMRTQQGYAKVVKAMCEGGIHPGFCMRLYRMQMLAGRYFVHEHLTSAVALQAPCVKPMSECPEVLLAKAYQYCFGLRPSDADCAEPVKKPTMFMTNRGGGVQSNEQTMWRPKAFLRETCPSGEETSKGGRQVPTNYAALFAQVPCFRLKQTRRTWSAECALPMEESTVLVMEAMR